MSDFAEYETALPAVAKFTLQDGREFLMSIEGSDEHGALQLGTIEGVPRMHREDFEQVASLVYLDELGRVAMRASRQAPPPS